MALDQKPVGPLAIGVGCRRGTEAAAVTGMLTHVLAGRDLAGARLFTLAVKADEPGLRAAAAALGLPLLGLPAELLAAQTDLTVRSARAAASVGVASVAEAAALAGAGPGSRLVVPRVSGAGVTCAVAVPAG